MDRLSFWISTKFVWHRLSSRYVSGVALLLLVSGCSQTVQSPTEKRLSTTDLDIKVTASTTPGAYSVSGSTDLPDQSQIRVAAIRYLHPDKQASRDLNPKPTYSILAYQTTRVNQGKWQAALNLWQVAADGRFQEAWQIDKPQLNLDLKPDKEVVFLAINGVDIQPAVLQKIDQQLRKQGKTLENGVILNTVDSQRYLQAGQTIAIALPTGKTDPPPVKPEDINGGWGNRFLMPEEAQNPIRLEFPEKRRTDAPPSPKEFLQ